MEETQIIQRAFDISPETVFGFLVALQFMLNLYLLRRNSKLQDLLIELNKQTVQSLNDAVKALERTREDVAEMKDQMLTEIFKSLKK